MDDQPRQMRYLILIAAVLCAVIIGYNAFYVPDASFSDPAVTIDKSSSVASSSEEYAPSSISPSVSSGAPHAGAVSSSGPATEKSSSASVQSGGKPQADSGNPGGKININTASARQLSDGLSGIGETLAARIVLYREQHGPFKSIDELENVDGIGDKKFAEIRGSVTVG